MTPAEISEASLALLNKVLDEGHRLSPIAEDLNSSRIAFCYRHGVNVSNLGNALIFLLDANRQVAARILIRPMIESMFKVAACYKVPHFHMDKMIAEIEHMIEWLKRDFPNPDPSIVAAIKDFQTEADDLKSRFGNVLSTMNWNIREVAKAGGIERLYLKDYRYFCDFTHCGITGLVQHEQDSGIAQSLQTGTMTMLVAASCLCGIFTMENATAYKLEALELTTKLNQSIASGDFAELDKKEAIP